MMKATRTRFAALTLATACIVGASLHPAMALDGDPANPYNCAAQWEVSVDDTQACGCSVSYLMTATNSPDCQDPCTYLGTMTKLCPGLATTYTAPFQFACGAKDNLDVTCGANPIPYLRARFWCAPCL